MSRIVACFCGTIALCTVSLTPAFAYVHNSPTLNKRIGSGCPDGMKMRYFGHGATFRQECVKKD